jgi:hypothetical protein
MADFKKNILFSGFKNPYKKIREIRKPESINELWNGKLMVESQTKNRVGEDSSFCPETSTKNAVQEFTYWRTGGNI